MSGALKNIRVLDLSRILAGPWSTQMLADLGAEVIKIEQPGKGDDTRSWGPPFIKNADGSDGDAAYFLCANRNKHSRCIDFTTQDGQHELHRLIKESDIVVENYKVGGLKKYHLDYDSVKDLNPGLIYCSITGFGQSGPYANRPGYDFLVQAMGGLMSVTGSPNSGPQKVGVAIADLMTGMYATTGILAALHHRNNTGEGQHIDISLLDCQVAMLANQAMNSLLADASQKNEQNKSRLMGNAHPNIVPYEAFATRDGYMVLAVGNDAQFARFCEVVDRQAWATDPRFARNAERVEHRESLVPMIREILAKKTTSDWVKILEATNISCGPVNSIEEVFNDPHVQARGLLKTLYREDGTPIPTVANPIRFSKTPVSYDKAPPALNTGANSKTDQQ